MRDRFWPTIGSIVVIVAAAGCGSNGTGTASRSETFPQASPASVQPGSKKPAPGVPTFKGGDNSIQTWGVEASARERGAARSLVQAYLDARAAARWKQACAYLVLRQRQMFKQAAAASQPRRASCATGMSELTSPDARPTLVAEARIQVFSLRVGRKYAFLIYRRPDGKFYATALGREADGWRVFSVSPTALR